MQAAELKGEVLGVAVGGCGVSHAHQVQVSNKIGSWSYM